MLTIPEYAIAALERGYTQRGPSVNVLAEDPDYVLPSRVLVLNSMAIAAQMPVIHASGRTVMLDLPDHTFPTTAATTPVSLSMSLIAHDDSIFFGLIAERADAGRLMLPICPEEHPDVLTWMLKSDALVLGHTFPSLKDDEFSVNILAAMNLSRSINLRMSMLILHALKGWPIPSVN